MRLHRLFRRDAETNTRWGQSHDMRVRSPITRAARPGVGRGRGVTPDLGVGVGLGVAVGVPEGVGVALGVGVGLPSASVKAYTLLSAPK